MPFIPTDQYGNPIQSNQESSLPTGVPGASMPRPPTPSFQPTDQYGRVMSGTMPATPGPSRAAQIGLLPALAENMGQRVKGGIMSFMADTQAAAKKTAQGLDAALSADQSYVKTYTYRPQLNQAVDAGANAVVTGFGMTRALAGGVLDLTGSLFKHLGITDAVTGELGNMGDVANGLVSTVDPTLVPKLKAGLSKTGDAYNAWVQQNPELADIIAGWGQIISAGLVVDQAAHSGADLFEKGKTTLKRLRMDAKYPNEIGLPQEIPEGTPGARAATEQLRQTGQDMINAGEVPNLVDAIPEGTPGALAAQEQLTEQAASSPVPLSAEQLRNARKYGIPDRDLAVVDGATPQERQVFNDQLAARKLELDSRMDNGSLGEVSGRPAIEKADYLQASRAETGKAMGNVARQMDQTPLDVTGAQDAFEARLQQDGVRFTQPMDAGSGAPLELDFSNSRYANDSSAQKLFTQMEQDFQSSGGQMSPVQIISIRRRIANDLDLFGKQKFLTGPTEGTMSTVRTALNQPLVNANSEYAALSQQYAKATTALKELYSFMGEKYAYADNEILSLRAAELGNRLTGRVPANAARVFNLLDSTAADLGYQGGVNLNRIFHFQDILNEYYPLPPPNSFQGQIIQGINNSAASEAVGFAKDILHPVKLGDRILQKIFNVTPEQRQAALEELIAGNTSPAQAGVQDAGAFGEFMQNPTIPGAGSIEAVGTPPEAPVVSQEPTAAPTEPVLPTDSAQAADTAMGQGSDSMGLKRASDFTNPAGSGNDLAMNPSQVPKIDRAAPDLEGFKKDLLNSIYDYRATYSNPSSSRVYRELLDDAVSLGEDYGLTPAQASAQLKDLSSVLAPADYAEKLMSLDDSFMEDQGIKSGAKIAKDASLQSAYNNEIMNSDAFQSIADNKDALKSAAQYASDQNYHNLAQVLTDASKNATALKDNAGLAAQLEAENAPKFSAKELSGVPIDDKTDPTGKIRASIFKDMEIGPNGDLIPKKK